MNRISWTLVAIIAAMLAFAGCAQKNAVNTAPLENSFKSAEPATSSVVDKTVAAIKNSDYAGAMAQLQTLASNAKLTPEQQQAVKDVIAQVQRAISDAASKVASGAGKSVDDLKKSLPK